jgi:hypothetical protein
MEHTWKLDVIDVGSTAGEKADIFAALDWAANVTLPRLVFLLH